MASSELFHVLFPLKGELGPHTPQPSGSLRTAAGKKGKVLEQWVPLKAQATAELLPKLIGGQQPLTSPKNECGPTY